MATEPVTAPDHEATRKVSAPTLDASSNGARASQGAVAPVETIAGEREAKRRRISLRTFDSLADRSFRWYFFSMFGWFASMNMQMLVRGVIVYELTGSYAALGFVSLANAIPGMALSLPGGVVADRLPKKKVVQVGQASNMIVAGVLAFLMLADLLVFWHLIACAVVQGTINSLIMPARQSMIAEIVDDDHLMNAVALNTAGMNVMRLLAPALGGVLLVLLGPGWCYMTIAGLYGAGAFLLIPVMRRAQAADLSKIDDHRYQKKLSSLNDIVEGGKYIMRDRTVAMILMINLLIVLFSMPYQMVLPGFVKDVLDGGPGKLGLMMSITGVGALAGSLVIASMPARNRGLILLLSSLLLGVAILFFAVSSWYWISLAICVAVGVGQSGRMSLSNVLIQAYTKDEYRGRVMSVYMLEFSLISFGTFVISVLANIIGVQMAIGLTALCLILLVFYSLAFMPRLRSLA